MKIAPRGQHAPQTPQLTRFRPARFRILRWLGYWTAVLVAFLAFDLLSGNITRDALLALGSLFGWAP